MRALFGAGVVLCLAVAMLARAEPPPAMENREISKIIAALKEKPTMKVELASVRFYAEVFGGTQLEAPMGSSLTTLGAWGDNGGLMAADASISNSNCGPLEPAQLVAASALLKEYGETLPLTLRAYTLGQQGKKAEAAELFATVGEFPEGPCPGEHPMYSGRRVGRIGYALMCVEAFAPKRDTSKLKKALQRATQCLRTNTAVG